MRITGGEWRGRRLLAPAGWSTRPSADRLRQSLFNILGEAVRGAAFLDLYAGSGAVGLEALSRGARPVVWIEQDDAAARALRQNLAALGLDSDLGATLCVRPALAALARLAPRSPFDFIFLDPPYADQLEYLRALRALDQRPRLAGASTLLIAECRRQAPPPEECGRWRRRRLHPQGDSALAFYRLAPLP